MWGNEEHKRREAMNELVKHRLLPDLEVTSWDYVA
jgi:hypothetical protein